MTYETPQEPQDVATPANSGSDETIDLAADPSAQFVDDSLATLFLHDPSYASRQQRILDMRHEAPMEKSPLAASFAGVNSDLFELELQYGECLRQALRVDGLSLDNLQMHSRSVDFLLKIIKQINQVTQLKRLCQKDSDDAADSERQDSAEAKKSHVCAPNEDQGQTDRVMVVHAATAAE